MSGKPMDPERLDSMREHMARGTVVVDYFDARALLADRDHQEALLFLQASMYKAAVKVAAEAAEERNRFRDEAMRWRSQCPVKAEHVEAAGVTRADALAWAHANCWAMSMHPTVHGFIEAVVSVGGYVAFEVLDEMATATPGGDQ